MCLLIEFCNHQRTRTTKLFKKKTLYPSLRKSFTPLKRKNIGDIAFASHNPPANNKPSEILYKLSENEWLATH
jgi:hypothetical protein